MRCRAGALLAVAALAGLATTGGLPARSASAEASATQAAGARDGAARAGSPVSVAITSINPPYATTDQKVTVRGSVTNTSSAPVSGLTVRLRSSSTAFLDRDELQQYSGGGDDAADSPEHGAVAVIHGAVAPGATVTWTAVLRAKEVRMTSFGVYPLAAQLTGTRHAALSTSRTFLPYWPTGKKAARPRPDDIAWLWPLMERPDQGPCAGLLSNGLAGSLHAGGRLSGLLAAGSSVAGRAARLTWVIDPGVLSSAQTMTRSYAVDASLNCRAPVTQPASPAAAAWLAGLKSAVARQPAFVTPYADADSAALTHRGLDGDLHTAFQDGRATAARVLRHDFTPAAAGGAGAAETTVAGEPNDMAWPADGLANYTMLLDLAAVDGIRTVVLSTAAMPPKQQAPYTPSAVTSTPNGETGNMRVLLADSTISGILGSAAAQSSSPGAAFAVRQRFLAETAMIAAEAPLISRAIVVAPPRRWQPAAGLAAGLLNDTISAPWLSPVSLGRLAAARHAPGRVSRQAPDDTGSQDFSRALARRIEAMDRSVAQVQSIQVTPDPQLQRAVAGVESAAWRDSSAAKRHTWEMLRRVTSYVKAQQAGVSIIAGPVTLGGQKGSVPVSIDNRLSYAVKVRIQLSVKPSPGRKFTVTGQPGVIVVGPDDVVTSRKLRVRAASTGTTTIILRLLTPDGHALPGQGVKVTVQATQFGTLALIILAAALGIFVITSAARAIRSGRIPLGPAPQDPADDDAPDPAGDDGYEQRDRPDNVVHDRAESGEAGTDHVLTEDADDYARVPGTADGG